MAFTYQRHTEIAFERNEEFLAKAEQLTPVLIHTERRPVRTVELAPDSGKLGGIWVRECAPGMDGLSGCALGRGERVILDFGRHLVGTFSVRIGSAGSPMDAPLLLRLRFAEMPCELAEREKPYDGWLSESWIQEERIHLDSLPATLELPRRYSFRYAELTVLDTSPKWKAVFSEPATDAVSAVRPEDCAPFAPGAEWEDEELRAIYKVGLTTLSECMQTVFEDGPKRDRRLWLGDLRIQALANYASFDHADLVKRCLYLFAALPARDGRAPANLFEKPRTLPDDTFLFDYGMAFVAALTDYLRIHPDEELRADLAPVALRQLDLALAKVDGDGRLRLGAEDPVFLDWSDAFDKSACTQAILIGALRRGMMLGGNVEGYRDALRRMEEFCRTRLYDSERGLFRTESGEVNLATQVWMVLAEVLPPAESRAVMERSVRELFPVRGVATPYLYHSIVEALLRTGLRGEGIRLLKEVWGGMVRLGADTFWEAFDPEHPGASPYGDPALTSYCHAWSCGPVYLLREFCDLR